MGNNRIRTFLDNFELYLDKIDISKIDLAGKGYINGKVYDFKLKDRKGKKADISIPLTFNNGIDDMIIYITDFDMIVMEAFLNTYIKNCKEDIEEPDIIYSQDIYTMIYGTDKPQEEQIYKVKKSIVKLSTICVDIDYSNFLKNKELAKKYGEQPLDDDEEEKVSRIMKLIQTFDIIDNETNTYELYGLQLLDIATIVTTEKDIYFTIEPDVFNKVTQGNNVK